MMEFVSERTKIAESINVKRVPVITIDLTKELQSFEHSYGGFKVVVATPTKSYPEKQNRCRVMMFGDGENEKYHDEPYLYRRILLQEGMIGITASFGLQDVREMVEWNQAPLLHIGQEVLVFFDDGKHGWLRRMKVNKYASALIDIDEKEDK